MNILDALIIILLILGIMGGMRRGLIKETVLLVGLIFIIVVSFYLRTPIATFMYKTLPFFEFSGKFQGVAILNILLYELIAFLIIFSILYLILRILLKVTGIIEKILKATIILGIFSKIGGAIVGFIESYVIIFIILFIFSQPFLKITGMNDSKIGKFILNNTPVMTPAVSNIKNATEELVDLMAKSKGDKFNNEAIDLFIKYDIITPENVKLLKEKGKLK